MSGEPVAESWEDETETEPAAPAPAAAPAAPAEVPKMNPFASSFNPNAGSFVPSWMKKEEPAAAPAAPEAPAAAPAPEPVEAAAPEEPTPAAAPEEGKGKSLAEIEAEELAALSVAEQEEAESGPGGPVLSKKFAPPEMSDAEIAKKKLKLVNLVFIGALHTAIAVIMSHTVP